MYDLNQPNDVIAQMRDGEMTDEQIIKVCKAVLVELKDPGTMRPLIGDWCVQDVHDRVADVYNKNATPLTDQEAEEVLDAAEANFDANEGFNWETMDYYIDQVLEGRATK